MTSPPRTGIDFEALFDAAPGIYLVLDAHFDIVAANAARLKATMTKRNEVIGRNLFEVFPDNPDDPTADGVRNLRTSLERVLHNKSADSMAVQKYDIPRPREQGGGFEVRYWSPLNTPVLGADGQVEYIIHRVEDVSDFMLLKEREASLQSHADRIEVEIYQRAREVQEANLKLETANAELGRLYAETRELAQAQQRFFSQVSHELRTPLTLILGPVERMLASPALLAPDQERDLDVVARNARTLLRHVNDLLDVVKYKSGAMHLAYARADLVERLRIAMAHFDSAASGRSLSVEVAAPEEVEADIDIEKFDRILINLLSNAYKFSPEHGRIRCSLSADADEATISIADQGPGVPDHLKDAIFEPFRQGDDGLTRRASGTGLGLAIVRDFVTMHGGAIAVGDAEGGGAVFECRLPLRAPAGAHVASSPALGLDDWNYRQAAEALRASAQPLSTAASASAPLVLVVEDNRDMAAFLAETLSSRYRVAAASDGEEGLREAIRLRPDLIVSDLMMPVMSGDQLVAALNERPELSDIPVLLLTARADEETRIDALRRGARDFLAKPFSVDELNARADNLVRAKRAADLVKRGKRVSEEKYSRLMDGARDAVFILTPEGAVLDANRRAEEFCGKPASSLIGLRLEEALDVRRPGVPANDVVQLVTRHEREEEQRFFEASSASVMIDDEAYRLSIVRDVTEQRRLEGQFRRVQKLDALGQLTGGIAHDFNNLLTAVAASAEALMARTSDRPDLAALARTIERAADSGAAMTRRLLAFARLQPVEVSVCDVNEVVAGAVEIVRRALPSNVSIEVAPWIGSWRVLIDPTQLQDALLNLAINARDAMPDGGRLRIATGELHVAGGEAPPLAPGEYVRILVSDTGAGMGQATLHRVFEPFFTTKAEGRGTGLGLSQVYGFARQAGGDVRIESELGVGTTVEILLPRPSPAAEAGLDERLASA